MSEFFKTDIDLIKEKTAQLQKYCHEYYDLDAPTISDKEYDRLYDELYQLEEKANFWLSNSPTRKVQGTVCDGFKKVTHTKPMLSAAKTKDINEIKSFLAGRDFYCSYKLDGLTLVVIYNNGELVQAITRGNGIIGEDVTEQAKMISNLPHKIPYNDYLELRGECVISWDNFNKVNECLEVKYSHPRNLASGSLRQLDTNITKSRNLSYVVFECVSGAIHKVNGEEDEIFNSKYDELVYLKHLGFEIVDRDIGSVEKCVKEMTPETYQYPVDGLIFELCDKEESKKAGATSHHENCRMALKWADETYETVLRDIEWNPTRTGVIAPVAVFDPIDLDGAITTRATLHNISIMEQLELGIGDIITVYRANQVIPKIDDNLTRSNTFKIPSTCPCCGSPAIIDDSGNSKFLKCTNKNCPARKISEFTHFVSKPCMNIDGLSEKTVETLINLHLIRNFIDIYYLYVYDDELCNTEGFGRRSVEVLLENIEKSRNVKLANFISALGIPLIGGQNSKIIAEAYNDDFNKLWEDVVYNDREFKVIGLGEVATQNFIKYFLDNAIMIKNLSNEMNFIREEKKVINNDFISGKTFCVTGAFNSMKRSEIEKIITDRGGKLSGSVSAKTDYLLTNDTDSGSSKAKKAKELGTKIMSEEEFLSNI